MKEENALEKAKETFTEFLQASHLRKTPERYAVLERAYRSEGHFSAESLYRDMQTEYRVSRATVYNTLELLLQSHFDHLHPLPYPAALFGIQKRRSSAAALQPSAV